MFRAVRARWLLGALVLAGVLAHASGCGANRAASSGTGGSAGHLDGGGGTIGAGGGSSAGGGHAGGAAGGSSTSGVAGASSTSGAAGGNGGGPADGGHVDAGATWWKPGTGELPWQWELDHEIDTNSPADMGTGDTTYTGAPAANPAVYDIDGFDDTAADVAALHALGKRVLCYIEVGASESCRPDASQFPAAALGSTVPGYPDETYLDINDPAVATILRARIAMCAQKGFDGIEPDIDDSFTDDTGFTITEAQEVAYLVSLSDYAHSLGVAWGLKNGGDGCNPPPFIAAMLPHVDFAVVEEPFFLGTIGYFQPAFDAAGKAMFVAEYTDDTASSSVFCPQAIADHTNAALFDVDLDGKVRDPCQ
jgi:hypothetical protein